MANWVKVNSVSNIVALDQLVAPSTSNLLGPFTVDYTGPADSWNFGLDVDIAPAFEIAPGSLNEYFRIAVRFEVANVDLATYKSAGLNTADAGDNVSNAYSGTLWSEADTFDTKFPLEWKTPGEYSFNANQFHIGFSEFNTSTCFGVFDFSIGENQLRLRRSATVVGVSGPPTKIEFWIIKINGGDFKQAGGSIFSLEDAASTNSLVNITTPPLSGDPWGTAVLADPSLWSGKLDITVDPDYALPAQSQDYFRLHIRFRTYNGGVTALSGLPSLTTVLADDNSTSPGWRRLGGEDVSPHEESPESWKDFPNNSHTNHNALYGNSDYTLTYYVFDFPAGENNLILHREAEFGAEHADPTAEITFLLQRIPVYVPSSNDVEIPIAFPTIRAEVRPTGRVELPIKFPTIEVLGRARGRAEIPIAFPSIQADHYTFNVNAPIAFPTIQAEVRPTGRVELPITFPAIEAFGSFNQVNLPVAFPTIQALGYKTPPFITADIPIAFPTISSQAKIADTPANTVEISIPFPTVQARSGSASNIKIKLPNIQAELVDAKDIRVNIPIRLPTIAVEFIPPSEKIYVTNLRPPFPSVSATFAGRSVVPIKFPSFVVEGNLTPSIRASIPIYFPTIEALGNQSYTIQAEIPIKFPYLLPTMGTVTGIPIKFPTIYASIKKTLSNLSAYVYQVPYDIVSIQPRISTFENYPYKKLQYWNGELYGLGLDNILYNLSANEDDAGEIIPCVFKTNTLQFKSNIDGRRSAENLHSIRYMYVMCRETNGFIVEVVTDEEFVDVYPEDHQGRTTMYNHKVILGEGRFGHSFNISIANRDGGVLDVSAISCLIQEYNAAAY